MKITKQQRGKVFQNLPEDIKDVFTDYKTTQTLIQVGNNHNLSEADRNALGKAIGLVLLGILNRKEFQEWLYEELSEEKQTINEIIKKVQPIFQPISGQLEKLDPKKLLDQAQQEEGGGGAAAEMPVPPPPPTSGDTPAPSYGGTSDPYREPTDE